MLKRRSDLVWFDGSAGAVVGVAVLLLSGWLDDLYGLPQRFVLFLGAVNLAYGVYSLTLARRPVRPRGLVIFLVFANLAWSAACAWWFVSYLGTASVFGLAQLAAECVFVGGLGLLEWRWLEDLLVASE